MRINSPVSLDVLILLVLVPAHMSSEGASYLLVIPMMIYILMELWHPLSPYSSLPDKLDRTRLSFLARLFILLIIVTASTVVPATEKIRNRSGRNRQNIISSDAYRGTHDGALQVEEALNFLGQGKNPYVEKYDETSLQYGGFSNLELSRNPAFDHFVYLPGFLVLSYPVYSVMDRLDLFYDQRYIYLFAYALLVLLLPLMVKPPSLKLLILAAVGLNPLLAGPVIFGMNDVLVLFLIAVMVLLLIRGKFLFSAVIFGLACTFKQSVWFLTPFYVLFLYPHMLERRRVLQLSKLLGVSVATAFVISAPFAFWDLSAFVTDVFSYPAGAVPVNYPIRGYTLGRLLLGMGVIESPLDRFPFWIFQLIIGVPLLVFLIKYQLRRNTVGSMLIAAGVFTFGMGVLSRFFQDNYVGYVAVVITLGIILGLGLQTKDSIRSSRGDLDELLLSGAEEEE